MTYFEKTPNFISVEPICASKPRLLMSEPVVLKMRESCNFLKLKHKYKITSECGRWDFKCRGLLLSAARGSKNPVENTAPPIIKFWRRVSPIGDSFSAVDWSTGRKLCSISTDPAMQGNVTELKLRVEFQDVVTDQPRLLVLKGNWEKKAALVYVEDPEVIKAGAVLVARISNDGNDCQIQVAANVDIALIVMLSIVFYTFKNNVQRVWTIPDISIAN